MKIFIPLDIWDSIKIDSDRTMHDVDSRIKEKYGLECINGLRYKVVDEHKIMLFILKYPECIQIYDA